MAKTWFRVHADGPASILRNRKIQTLPPPLFKWLVNLWALACERDGILPAVEDVAWLLHEPEEETRKALEELTKKRFLDRVNGKLTIHDWSFHQFEETSTDRVRKFRERKRNGGSNEGGNGGETEGNGNETGGNGGNVSGVSSAFHETRARASESESESESVSSSFPSREENSVVLVTPPAAFEKYLVAFYAGGKLLSPKDEQDAFQLWLDLPLADQMGAIQSAVEINRSQGDPQFIPFPANHLRKQPWKRTGPGRMLPMPRKLTRVDLNHAEATAEFLAEQENNQ